MKNNLCEFCGKEINNRGSLVKHQNGCKLNPKRKIYKSNFINYNKKVKDGEIKKDFINQYDKHYKLGLKIPYEWRKNVPDRNGVKLSVITKQKLSKARSKFLEEMGGGGFKHIKWYKIKNVLGDEFIVRGTWELRLAEKMNELNILWVRKKYLEYDLNGQIKTYSPDFYLPKQDIYLEVKGYFSKKDRLKMSLVENFNNIKIKMIFEEDLIKIENNCIEILYKNKGTSN
jgi:hypothetical protein